MSNEHPSAIALERNRLRAENVKLKQAVDFAAQERTDNTALKSKNAAQEQVIHQLRKQNFALHEALGELVRDVRRALK